MTFERTLMYPDFFRVAARQQAGDIDFDQAGDSDDPNLNVEKLVREKPLHEANSVSSRLGFTGLSFPRVVDPSPAMHNLVLDIDHDAVLIPTTTPGHHHLIINAPMVWDRYRAVLDSLLLAGIIEEGYHRATVNRGASWIRTPWTPKA